LKSTSTHENYLKALFNLKNEADEVSLTELSHYLKVSLPSVNSMVKRFHELGWLVYEKYKPLQLTQIGKKEAALIIRKHRLTEMFLVDKMGFGWEEVHDIAEQIEHVASPLFFNRMDEIMGFPKYDPHGSPIPDREGNIIPQNFRKLIDCIIGEKVTLAALQHSSDSFLKYLNTLEMQIGVEITIIDKMDFDNSLQVAYGARDAQFLSEKVSERLLVK
jgi:DtxR family transcriptional regulator, Mn-dependent transcriptional regulator